MIIDLSKLTEFNQALIYGFEAETTIEALLSGSGSIVDRNLPEAGQYEDMYAAYMWAQGTILPALRAGNPPLTAKLLSEWISKLHQLIAKTLLANAGLESGEYITSSIFRWHHGAVIQHQLIYYFSDKHRCKTDHEISSFLRSNNGTPANTLDLVKLLRRLLEDKSITMHASEVKEFEESPQEHKKGCLVFYKLHNAYATNKLSDKDKETVNSFVKICKFAFEIPAEMQRFTTNFVENYKKCPKDNLDKFVELLAESFYELTNIHPFDNGNGRVATCLLNIWLRSVNLPSILLRVPGDKENPNSAYSLAFDQIDKTREPLKQLILTNILAAQKQAFVNDQLKQVILLRIEFAAICKRILALAPEFDLELLKREISPMSHVAIMTQPENIAAIFVINEMIGIASRKERALTAKLATPTYALGRLTPDQKAGLLSKLALLSEKSDWSINQKNGLVCWLEKVDGEAEAKLICDKINKAGVATASVRTKTLSDKTIWFVWCESVALQKILALPTAETTIALNCN